LISSRTFPHLFPSQLAASSHNNNNNNTLNNKAILPILRRRAINQTVTLAAASKLKSSWQGVAEGMIGLPLTERFIQFLQTIDECSEERPWENLRMEKYYNKVFTKELYQDLTSMWDDVADKLVGLEMTPKLIDLLNHLQGTPTSN